MTQADLADLAGTSRETANRVMGGFARRGWLKHDVGQVSILDIPALRKRAGERDAQATSGGHQIGQPTE
jgi:hypothetical protein